MSTRADIFDVQDVVRMVQSGTEGDILYVIHFFPHLIVQLANTAADHFPHLVEKVNYRWEFFPLKENVTDANNAERAVFEAMEALSQTPGKENKIKFDKLSSALFELWPDLWNESSALPRFERYLTDMTDNSELPEIPDFYGENLMAWDIVQRTIEETVKRGYWNLFLKAIDENNWDLDILDDGNAENIFDDIMETALRPYHRSASVIQRAMQQVVQDRRKLRPPSDGFPGGIHFLSAQKRALDRGMQPFFYGPGSVSSGKEGKQNKWYKHPLTLTAFAAIGVGAVTYGVYTATHKRKQKERASLKKTR